MALIKINDRMINQMKEEFDLTFEQAKELLCADLASDKRELDLTNFNYLNYTKINLKVL